MSRPVLVAAAVAIAAALLPGIPAGASGPVTLAEVTTVTGPATVSTTVVLPKDVRLDFDDAAAITGGGALAGVALREVGELEFGLLAARLPGSDTTEVLYTRELGVLPAGTYRLTVFGAAPSTIRLELPGLGGTASVVTEPTSGTVAPLSDVDALPGNRGLSVGGFGDLERPGLLLHAVITELAPGGHVTDHGSCFRDETDLDALTAWHVCTGSGVGWTRIDPVGSEDGTRVRAVGFAWEVEPGSRGQGAHMKSDTELRLVDAIGVWVPLV